MKVALGSDHGGIHLKAAIKEHLESKGYEVIDYGTKGDASVDYPDFGEKVAMAIVNKEAELGVLVCGTGLGISIAANKVKGIRAAHASDTFTASMARCHNDANILALGERVVGVGLGLKIVDAFFESSFEGDRHQRRVDKISAIEEKNFK